MIKIYLSLDSFCDDIFSSGKTFNDEWINDDEADKECSDSKSTWLTVERLKTCSWLCDLITVSFRCPTISSSKSSTSSIIFSHLSDGDGDEGFDEDDDDPETEEKRRENNPLINKWKMSDQYILLK